MEIDSGAHEAMATASLSKTTTTVTTIMDNIKPEISKGSDMDSDFDILEQVVKARTTIGTKTTNNGSETAEPKNVDHNFEKGNEKKTDMPISPGIIPVLKAASVSKPELEKKTSGGLSPGHPDSMAKLEKMTMIAMYTTTNTNASTSGTGTGVGIPELAAPTTSTQIDTETETQTAPDNHGNSTVPPLLVRVAGGAGPQPGAYAMPGMDPERVSNNSFGSSGVMDDDDDEPSPAIQEHSDNNSNNNNNNYEDLTESGLAVASLVPSNDEEMPQASEVDVHSRLSLSAQKRKSKESKNGLSMMSAAIGAIILIVILVIVVIVITQITNKDEEGASQAPAVTESPSQAPTSWEDSVLALLPDDTVKLIFADPESPQSKAWEWLLEDIEFHNSSLPESRFQQRYALATLFYATGGEEWVDNSGWLNHSVHECDYYNEPEFATISIVNYYYEGWLSGYKYFEPPLEGQCDPSTGLYQHLWLDRNNLVGSIPDEMYMLTELRTISFSFNTLGGTLSTLLGQLTALNGIIYSEMAMEGPIPSEIGLLTNLEVLSFQASTASGRVPSEVWQLTNLLHLGLDVMPRLQGTISSAIGHFEHLRYLAVGVNDLSGTIPTEIGLLSSLEWISLSDNRLSGSIPSELGLLPSASILDASNSSFVGMLPSELGQLSKMTALRLFGNQFSGTLPSQFGLITDLAVSLMLNSNSLTGPIPTELGLLSKLHKLDLQENQLSGSIPSEFGQLSSIGQLSLDNNTLTGTVPQELAVLQATLYTLTLDGNPLLEGTIPDALCILTNGDCPVSAWDDCEPEQGLVFDCDVEGLCGCGCTCGGIVHANANGTW